MRNITNGRKRKVGLTITNLKMKNIQQEKIFADTDIETIIPEIKNIFIVAGFHHQKGGGWWNVFRETFSTTAEAEKICKKKDGYYIKFKIYELT